MDNLSDIKKNKKIVTALMLILTVIIITPAFIMSCQNSPAEQSGQNGAQNNPANSGESGDGKTADGTNNAASILPEWLPARDFGGYEFRILTRDTPHHSMYIDSEEVNGEPINDAVYNRNRIIEDAYNIKIKSIWISEFEGAGGESYLQNTLRTVINAGSDEYDLAMVHMIHSGSLGANNFLIDWKEIPHVDLSKPWWDQGVTEGLVINNRLYINSGDFNIECTDHTWGMIFNKQLWQDFGYSDIYEAVKNGKWTLDYFNDIIKQSTKDLNGDGIFDANDQFGFITVDRGALTNFMYGSNERVYQKNNSGGFDLILNNERMQAVVEKTNDIYWNNNSSFVFMTAMGYNPDIEPISMFMENKGLISAARLVALPKLRGMEIDFGVIPHPKFDENQDGYYTYSDGHSSMMCIPKTMPDPDRFGIIIEALAYSSRNLVLPAFYDISLNTKFTRDEESSEMLDIIINNRIFDIGYVYNDNTGSLGFIINELIQRKSITFASEIERKESRALTALEKLIENFGRVD